MATQGKGKTIHWQEWCVEPSFKHRSLYSHCDTYEGLVTVDDTIVSSGVFNIVRTNKSKQTRQNPQWPDHGMLHSCEDSQICTIHEIVSFGRNPREGRMPHLTQTPQREFLLFPTRNPKTGRLQVNTLPRKDF